jgi:hypothetical protein
MKNNNNSSSNNDFNLAIIATVAALALLGVLAVTIVSIPHYNKQKPLAVLIQTHQLVEA